MKKDMITHELDDKVMANIIGGAGNIGQGVDDGGVRIIFEHCPVCYPDKTQEKTGFEVNGDIAKCVNCGYILLEQSSL